MTANEEREEGIDFTTPYYESDGMVMIVKKEAKKKKRPRSKTSPARK